LWKCLYPLSLWERVGVRVFGCPVIACVSLILAFSQREKGQDKIDLNEIHLWDEETDCRICNTKKEQSPLVSVCVYSM
jgi:hypothetical protein